METCSGKAKKKEPPKVANLSGQRVGDSPFIVQDYLCGGAFGQIYTGFNELTTEKVAIKMESKDSDKAQLYLEFGFYLKLDKCPNTPHVYYFGLCGNWNALVMEILGPSLLAMFRRMDNALSLKTIAAIGLKLTELIQFVHNRGLIYRDVKPENFLLGLPNTNKAFKVHLIDLGLCKEYRLDNGDHIPFQQGKCITGTIQYMSVNMHFGYELSRRDDLEAIMYMLIFLHKGALPWTDINKTEPNIGKQILKIGELKLNIPPSKLCMNMTEDFEFIVKRIKELSFEQEPQYNDYIERFLRILDRSGVQQDFNQAYDWDQSHKPKQNSRCSLNSNNKHNRHSKSTSRCSIDSRKKSASKTRNKSKTNQKKHKHK